MIDYRTLLLKYFRYVGDVEGSNSLYVPYRYLSDVQFTDEEWKELQRLDKEIQEAKEQPCRSKPI